MNIKQAKAEVVRIINSAGRVDKEQVADAFLYILDKVSAKDQPEVMEYIITRFDPNDQFDHGNFGFASPWPEERWKQALFTLDIGALAHSLAIAASESNGNPLEAAKRLLSLLALFNDRKLVVNDRRVVVFVHILFTGVVPFNFYKPEYRMDQDEFNTFADHCGVNDKLEAAFEKKVRFITAPDQAFYFLKLLKDKGEKTQAVILSKIISLVTLHAQMAAEEETKEKVNNAFAAGIKIATQIVQMVKDGIPVKMPPIPSEYDISGKKKTKPGA